MDAFVASRIALLVEFYEGELEQVVHKSELKIDSLKSEVSRLSTENTSLKEELQRIVIQRDIPPVSREIISDKQIRTKVSPSKAPRDSSKSPEEVENSEPHANALPVLKRTRVQTAAKTSIPNPRSTRTRTKNT